MGYISQLRVACSNTASDRMNSKIGTPAGSTKDVYHYVNLEGFLKCFEKTFLGFDEFCRIQNSANFAGQQTNYSEDQGKVIQKMIWLSLCSVKTATLCENVV